MWIYYKYLYICGYIINMYIYMWIYYKYVYIYVDIL